MKMTFRLLPLFLIGLWLAACKPQVASQGSPVAWIDKPLDGSALPLAPVEVISHAADPSGIVQFELRVNGTVVGTGANLDASSALATIDQTWNPPAPGDYTVEVRAQNSDGIWGDYAVVDVHVGAPVPSPAGTLTPAATPDHGPITFTPLLNANCRIGPAKAYEIVDSLLAGNAFPAGGRNEDKNWVYILVQGNGCWISLATGQVNGRIDLLPFHPYPPLPTGTPTPVLGCYAYDQNQQLVCQVPCSPNAQPGGACTP
jgi:hypothetical protein